METVEVYEDSQKLGWVVHCPCKGERYYATRKQALKAADNHRRKQETAMTQPYGQSGVGTEATPTLEQEINLRVLDRDGRVCLACGTDGVFNVDGETTIRVLKRDPDWRHVAENLVTLCDLHGTLQGSAQAQADGFSFKVRTGDPVGNVPVLTHMGYRWLSHEATLLTRRPK